MNYFKYTTLILITLGVFCITPMVHSAINPLLEFQGKVTNTDGSELPDGSYDFSFDLYATPTGGAAIWSETLNAANLFSATISNVATSSNGVVYTYTGGLATTTLYVGQYLNNATTSEQAFIVDFDTSADTITVASGSAEWTIGDPINNRPHVEGGVIDVKLGSVTGLTTVDFDQPLYLEVTFNGETMQPRKYIAAVAQAFNADKLDGFDASDFLVSTGNQTIDGEWTFANILNVATSSNTTALTVTQTGTGDLLDLVSGVTTVFKVHNDGSLTIGDYTLPATDGSPGYVLKSDGSGNLTWQVDLAGFGGSGLWATSSNNLVIRPVDTAQVTVLGGIATSSTGYIFEVNGSSYFDNIAISKGQEARFYNPAGTYYTGLQASTSLSSNIVFSLPATLGTGGDSLMVDDLGNMYWGMPVNTHLASGTLGQFAYYTGGQNLGATSSLFVIPSGFIGIGTTTPNSQLTIAGNLTIDGNVLPYSSLSSDIGAVSQRFNYGYFSNLDVTNLVIGSSSISGTNSNTLTINSDNLTADLEDSYLAFERGSLTPNASLRWDSINDRFEFNFPLYLSSLYASSSLGIGTTSPSQALTVGSSTGSQFLVNDFGQVVGGTWMGDVLSVPYGGTGTTTWTANSLVYAPSANTLGEILPTTGGHILQLNGSNVPSWVSTSSLGIDFNGIGGTLSVDQGGTGQDFTGQTGFVYIDGGIMEASSTIAITFTDLSAASGIVLTGNILTLDNTGNWAGTIGLIDPADIFQLSDWYATTTDALAEGGNNLYWSNGRFDARLSATTSLPNLTTLNNLSSVGTITSGTWQGDIIGVAYGGTGTSTFTANALVYADADNHISEILPGLDGYALVMNGGIPTWSSTSPGTVHPLLGVAQHSDVSGAAPQAGDLIYRNGSSQWDRLAISAGAGYVLYSNGTTPSWSDFGTLFATEFLATTTDTLTEGGNNLYFTTTRARNALSATSPLSYDSGTGIFSIASGFTVPVTGSTTEWTSAYTTVTSNSANWDTAYGWGDHAGLYDVLGQATSTLASHTATYDHDAYDTATAIVTASNTDWTTAFDAITASSGDWTTAFDTVTASSSLWDTAYGWGDHAVAGYFTLNDWYATTSAPQLTDLVNLSSVGTITNGTWQGTAIDNIRGGFGTDTSGWSGIAVVNSGAWGTSTTLPVYLGGTGTTTWTANSLVYADADNSLSQILPGDNGYALVMSGGVPTWSSTTPGVAHDILSTQHLNTDATSSLERGDLMVVRDFAGENKWSRLELGTSGYILYSDGTDTIWASTSAITQLGTITQGLWRATPIEVAYGGTGATTATSARENLGLDDVYTFGITSTGTDGYVWQSDGDGRGQWVATGTLGIGGGGITQTYAKFIGTTTYMSNGTFATSTLTGYAAANNICASEFTDSFFCRTYDMLATIEQDDISYWGNNSSSAWMAEGPPGYISNSNDCMGWKDNTTAFLGAYWKFNSDGGGAGYLINCEQTIPLACCAWQ